MEIKAFLLCEDIRREVGNKCSLMGLLNEGLNYDGPEADVWPKSTNIAAFIRLSVGEDDSPVSDFSLVVTLDGDEVASIKSEFSVPKGTKTLNLPVTMYGFPLASAGLLTFNFKLLHQEHVLIEAETTLKISAN